MGYYKRKNDNSVFTKVNFDINNKMSKIQSYKRKRHLSDSLDSLSSDDEQEPCYFKLPGSHVLASIEINDQIARHGKYVFKLPMSMEKEAYWLIGYYAARHDCDNSVCGSPLLGEDKYYKFTVYLTPSAWQKAQLCT